jgi:hypothetical protein
MTWVASSRFGNVFVVARSALRHKRVPRLHMLRHESATQLRTTAPRRMLPKILARPLPVAFRRPAFR